MSYVPVSDPFYTHKLIKPITILGDEITELSIREPTLSDLLEVGDPTKFDPRTIQNEGDLAKLECDHAIFLKMLNRLSNGAPEASLAKMSIADFKGIWWRLAVFFIPA